MFMSFTRRNKLDYEPCELRYKFIPAPFRYDLLKLVLEKLREDENGHVREYGVYRHLSIAVNKDYEKFFGEDAIYEFYTNDLLIDLVRSAEWHEVLSMAEDLLRGGLLEYQEVNDLFSYHHVGYEATEKSHGAFEVEVKYDSVVEEAQNAEAATAKYPTITALLKEARAALAAPQSVSVETSVSSAMKAIEGYLKEWLKERGISVATLGDAVKTIKSKKLVDTSIVEALHQFYIYRNKQPNVGHGNVAESGMTTSEALLVLDMAASFINYFHRQGKPEFD